MSIPIITHSEITDNIYIVCGGNKYNVTEQVIKAMRETGRLEQRPHGEWIEKEDFNQDIYYDCSVCGNSWCTLDGTPWQNGMNFCPNCGADMRKEGE